MSEQGLGATPYRKDVRHRPSFQSPECGLAGSLIAGGVSVQVITQGV